MRIWYDVKKRRIIIRFTIAIICISSVVLLVKGCFNTPSGKQHSSMDNTKTSLPVILSSPSSNTATPTISQIPVPTPTPTNKAIQTVLNPNTPTATSSASQKITNNSLIASSKVSTPTPSKVATPKSTKTSIPTTPPKNPTSAPNNSNDSTSSGELQIMYFNSITTSSSNTINPMFRLINYTKNNINLSDIRIRYYFTADSEIKQNFWCDWCSAGTSNVFGNFIKLKTPKANADQYLEIGFRDDSGVIKPNETVEIQIRFSKDNWTEYIQSNDYSFNPSKEYLTSDKITLYLKGNLIFGKEP